MTTSAAGGRFLIASLANLLTIALFQVINKFNALYRHNFDQADVAFVIPATAIVMGLAASSPRSWSITLNKSWPVIILFWALLGFIIGNILLGILVVAFPAFGIGTRPTLPSLMHLVLIPFASCVKLFWLQGICVGVALRFAANCQNVKPTDPIQTN